MNVCVISFSGRQKGNSRAVCQLIRDTYQKDNITVYDFSEFDITPCGKCAYECFENRMSCPYRNDNVFVMYESIIKSDITYFVMPNYCDYPPANFFIFNERSQCFFQGQEQLLNTYLEIPKKFIVISNTGKENFTNAFLYQVNGQPDILFLSAKSYGKRSIDGDLMMDDEARQNVIQFIESNNSFEG